jgi:hypothetical protein
MKNQPREIPTAVHGSAGRLIPIHPDLPVPIQRIVSSHAAVLQKWSVNFSLDLHRPPIVRLP